MAYFGSVTVGQTVLALTSITPLQHGGSSRSVLPAAARTLEPTMSSARRLATRTHDQCTGTVVAIRCIQQAHWGHVHPSRSFLAFPTIWLVVGQAGSASSLLQCNSTQLTSRTHGSDKLFQSTRKAFKPCNCRNYDLLFTRTGGNSKSPIL